ncbi:MAG: DNA polymerase IV [Flavobacteriia bacterium]
MDRTVVHMDLDTFFVSCERLVNSELNGIPLIIGGNSDRGVVASCSYEARHFGVRSAMPMKMALRLCPQAKIVKGDMELYSNQSKIVTEIISEQAPVIEKASVDEFYLDISGMDRFFGSYKWTNELSQRITKETGLPISFGLSVNKTVSKIATGEGKPQGKIQIEKNAIKPFLNPLSIKKIPMLGNVTFVLLSRIGVRQIETLSKMPVEYLQSLLGKNGKELWKKANGIDETPIEPYSERKSLSKERTFDQDSIDLVQIKAILIGMVESLAFQLRKENWLTSCVVVKIRYTNFDTEVKQSKLAYTASDHVLIEQVKLLFDKVYTRRMRLRLVGVSFTGLVRGNYQINLFEDTAELISLYQAIDKMKKRFGEGSIKRSVALLKK